ncbi:MAG: sugar nucleotide-binding protein, partial [Candidatus Micrarchaeota archaeon]
MKIAIFGSNGLLGTAASRQFAAGGHQVVRISRSEEADYAADASDIAAVEKIVSREKPEVVLNAIKSAQSTDAAEEQRAVAWASNVIVPQNLASLCEKFSCKLVHISSDWVYEGRESEVYTEESLPYPQNFYAYTKAVAEERVRLLCPGSLILRTT